MKITIQYILYHNNVYDNIVRKFFFDFMVWISYYIRQSHVLPTDFLLMLMLRKMVRNVIWSSRDKNIFETRNDKFNKTFNNFPIFGFLSIVASLLHTHEIFSLIWNEWSMKHASAMNFPLFFHLLLLYQ